MSPDDLERLAARTWRGVEEEGFGDWLLRASDGFTGRANSVLVVGEPPAPLGETVGAVTRWYAARGLPPRAQLPMPGAKAVDDALAAAGWRREDDSLVLTASLAGWRPTAVPVDLRPEPDEAWLAGYQYRGAPLPAVARKVLLSADRPVFASVRSHPSPGPPSAVARGVLVDGWLVVTAVTVDERYRRRGLATALMAALGGWAREQGGHSCLLQVAADNAAALVLYAGLGFTEHHRYHYRLGPQPVPPA